MFHTIFRKLVAVLLLFGLLMCLIFAMIMQYSHEVYHQEAQQKFHASTAMRLATLAGWTPSGWRDPADVAAAFARLMTASPQFHVFVLDRDGRVLSHYPDNLPLLATRVSLLPIKQLLQADPHLPILGDDPTRPATRQIFSVARLPGRLSAEQYLYVTLHSEEHDPSAEGLRLAYLTREGAWLVVASLILAMTGGLLSLHFIVRPIKQLASTMESFRERHFNIALIDQHKPMETGDEIDTLNATFFRMAQQIQMQMRAIEQADATRREFVTNVSHDLRTPLASLQGYLDTLILKNDTLTPPERQQFLQIALNQSKSLSQLISALFYLARLDSGQISLQTERFKIDEVVQDLVQKFAPEANSKNIQLVAEPQGLLPFVCADLGLIERALSNLIDNALRHTPDGGSVQLRLWKIGHKVWVSVINSGSSILAADLPHIFERFYRGHSAVGQATDNAGLGLSIVRRILEMHGETVEAANMPGQGVQFRFSLSAPDVQDASGDQRALSV